MKTTVYRRQINLNSMVAGWGRDVSVKSNMQTNLTCDVIGVIDGTNKNIAKKETIWED